MDGILHGFSSVCNIRMAFSVAPNIHGLGGSPQGQVTPDFCFARIDSGVNIPWPVFALVSFPGSGHSPWRVSLHDMSARREHINIEQTYRSSIPWMAFSMGFPEFVIYGWHSLSHPSYMGWVVVPRLR